jgi:pantoate--beta-alanine ligase
MAASHDVLMGLHVIESIGEIRRTLSVYRREGKSIGLVPTMGALHGGHASLIKAAARDTDYVIVSIFVNPIQFNDPEDYSRYPRDLEADAAFCESLGVPVIFAPSPQVMYPEPQLSFVEVEGVSEHLCGKFRPGHFRGVATVVLKLLQIVQPDRAYFGEKDIQQLAVIQRMVRDLNVPVEIVGVPTVRESDGLAISSRNQHLTPEQRSIAPLLYQALQLAGRRIAEGGRDSESIKRAALAALLRPEIRLEYLEIVDARSLRPVERIEGPVRVAAAIWLGSTRLIDNAGFLLPDRLL